MKWKILATLDIAFSTLAVISALVLGNGIVAEHVPTLHDNATWLSKLIMTGLTAPDALADWALGFLPVMLVLFLFTVFISAEVLLITLSPFVVGMIAFTATKKYDIDFLTAYRQISTNGRKVDGLKRHILRRVMVNLLTKSLVAFGAGLAAGGIAWGIALLINANSGGIIQTLAVIAVVGVLLFAKMIVDAILEEVTAEDVVKRVFEVVEVP
jgi:hypothetical protein